MEQNNKESKKRAGIIRTIVIIILLSVAGFFGYKKVHFALTHETTDNAQIETQITPVLPRVAGYVKSITVKLFSIEIFPSCMMLIKSWAGNAGKKFSMRNKTTPLHPLIKDLKISSPKSLSTVKTISPAATASFKRNGSDFPL